ncbi:carbon storage regulator CsrA [Caldicoprobacter faecalis]|uniref:Translational regulator CsrA n=1 Tax=Caldicoprobacter faecalis TaxID=937334 RepID=A0A1I5V727_9FIRM|nr:carbon storage regulator CsrA [Caldicoprobacter faecalis]PZN07354.1 MAG: carbon storage regulator [Caldicoprobacter oshimai]SFQ02766.1 carbon storage regulator, CsrA [Caldicoprobacter faecalis]
MLVLTRKPGQSILIGDNIEVKIIDVQGDQVRIGINAPKDISILRKELMDEVRQANREAVVDSFGISLEELNRVLKE